MYRDTRPLPDDRDPAIAAIQIADGLIDDCAAAADALRAAPHAAWTAVRLLQDSYPALWSQLDRARDELAARGVNTAAFDELRGEVRPALVDAELDTGHRVDAVALDDARRASGELRLAIPGADWRALDARSTTLASANVRRRGQRFVALGYVVACAAVVCSIAATNAPASPAPRPALTRARDLTPVVTERRERIAQLDLLVGDRCDAHRVHELLRLMVMDGRWQAARSYGVDYQRRCGDDAEVARWVAAPRPPRR